MTGCSEILVLVANEASATLCANTDGITRQLRTIDRVLSAIDGHRPGETSLDPLHVFACELMMALRRSADEHSYDGVIIFAEAEMMKELRRVQTDDVGRLMIGQIVGKPSHYFTGCAIANTESVCVGIRQ